MQEDLEVKSAAPQGREGLGGFEMIEEEQDGDFEKTSIRKVIEPVEEFQIRIKRSCMKQKKNNQIILLLHHKKNLYENYLEQTFPWSPWSPWSCNIEVIGTWTISSNQTVICS